MSLSDYTFTVFTKAWKTPLPQLAQHIHSLGLAGIELPIRPGYPVTPDNMATELPVAARIFADHGLTIASVVGPLTEKTVAACGAAKVPVLRHMPVVRYTENYMEVEARWRREYEALVPHLSRYGVKLGVQNHCDEYIAPAMGLRHLIEPFDPQHIGAIWDAAHGALNGEDPELGLDIVWSHLCMVNLKNAYWKRTNGPDAPYAQWDHIWTSGRHGLAYWPRVAAVLKKRQYRGVICFSAEYTEEKETDQLIAEDLAFAQSLLA
jgi:sugar phosphate isomerase/epimerase